MRARNRLIWRQLFPPVPSLCQSNIYTTWQARPNGCLLVDLQSFLKTGHHWEEHYLPMFYYRGDFIWEEKKITYLREWWSFYVRVFTFVVAMAFTFNNLGDVVSISYKCMHCSLVADSSLIKLSKMAKWLRSSLQDVLFEILLFIMHYILFNVRFLYTSDVVIGGHCGPPGQFKNTEHYTSCSNVQAIPM